MTVRIDRTFDELVATTPSRSWHLDVGIKNAVHGREVDYPLLAAAVARGVVVLVNPAGCQIIRTKYTDGDVIASLERHLQQIEDFLVGAARVGVLRDVVLRYFCGEGGERPYEPFGEWLCEIAGLNAV